MDSDNNENKRGNWTALGRELMERTVRPCFHPSFVMFFVVAICGVGPLGFWIELASYVTSQNPGVAPIRASFISFVPAFLAGTTMQLIWAESKSRSLRAFSIFMLCACGVALVFCGYPAIQNGSAITAGVFAAVIALWMWWIANANQQDFLDDPSDISRNPIGGDRVDTPLSGDLSGFRTE
ncbi:hypothetical protein ACW9YV_32675 (plasmid) [Paraburkholderia strydomiana]